MKTQISKKMIQFEFLQTDKVSTRLIRFLQTDKIQLGFNLAKRFIEFLQTDKEAEAGWEAAGWATTWTEATLPKGESEEL